MVKVRAIMMAGAGLPLALFVAACGGAGDAPSQGASAAASAAPGPTTATPAPSPAAGEARKVKIANDFFEFDYSYPAAAAAIPGLKSWLDADMGKDQSRVAKEARAAAKEAKNSDFPFRPWAYGVEWKVVTDLPGWLSLSAAIYEDRGGAHPANGYGALLWDKGAGQQRKAEDLFASKAALSAAIREPFCAMLDKERAKRRGEPVVRSGEWPNDCIDPAGSTVILGSSDRAHFNRIGILVGPYEAGPYAEGDYEITLPVDVRVMAAVRPEYRAAFAAGK
ncbi:DUF4163 domain-containing protein [Novosphingobium sp. KACC 22771]|uniref:DUF4163 domain-containing protein n=1 Tax=Novosphingobium sp. KACC 22771 TaxID=3025670 RepID=UPI002365755B|nr:DUF4163 domain-containing protein [Novosphingobium sp. KACC 22771]WDF72128.1 DUF4163 domain-containing protein [Novosphingobium sp. KACC 22771]